MTPVAGAAPHAEEHAPHAEEHGAAGGMGSRRVLVHASGFRQSPYADLRPAGEDSRNSRSIAAALPGGTAPGPREHDPRGPDPEEHDREPEPHDGRTRASASRKLWHSSAGSSGW